MLLYTGRTAKKQKRSTESFSTLSMIEEKAKTL